MNYDFFISYRRVDSEGRVSGRDIARTLQKELQLRNYKVFFDYSEIRDNEFDATIIPAIRSSKFFILLLTHDALLRCANTGDWVHREILTALQSGVKIIPVNPDGQFNGWPSNLPVDISSIKTIQISEIATNSLFETSIDKLEADRIKPEKPHLQPNTNKTMPHSTEKKTPTSVPPAKVAKATPKVAPSEKTQITDKERVKLYRSLGMTNAADELERKMKREKQWWSKPYNVMNDFLMVPITNYLLAYTVLTIMVIYHLSVGSCFGFMISGFDIVMAVIFSLVGIYCSLKMGIITDDSKEIKNIWMGILSFLIILFFSPFWGIVIGGITGCIVDWWLHWQDLHATYLIYIYIVILVFSLYTLTHTLIKRRKEKTEKKK